MKTLLRRIANRSARARRLMRSCMYLAGWLPYKIMALFCRIDDKRVLFASFDGRSYSDTPKAVYEYMASCPAFAGFTFVWVFKAPGGHRDVAGRAHTKTVRYGTAAHLRELARSKYWVVNFRVFDYAWPGPGRVYLQCWHGTPLKKLGFDSAGSDNAMNSRAEITGRYANDARKMTWLLSPSAYATEKFTSAWNLAAYGREDRIVEVGYPKNDRLAIAAGGSDADAGVGAGGGERIRVGAGLPESSEKKVILYAPTWRDDQFDPGVGYTYDLKIDFGLLREAIGDEFDILFRAHYLVRESFDFAKYEGFIYDCSGYDDIGDLCLISDMLLTDYSSVFFDYSILNRPMLFYMYDLEEYGDRTRGFYFDVSELPGRIVTDERELASAILGVAGKGSPPFTPDDKYLAFKEKYVSLDDGEATARLVGKVWPDVVKCVEVSGEQA